jgi:hypothetical protein
MTLVKAGETHPPPSVRMCNPSDRSRPKLWPFHDFGEIRCCQSKTSMRHCTHFVYARPRVSIAEAMVLFSVISRSTPRWDGDIHRASFMDSYYAEVSVYGRYATIQPRSAVSRCTRITGTGKWKAVLRRRAPGSHSGFCVIPSVGALQTGRRDGARPGIALHQLPHDLFERFARGAGAL